MPTENQTTQSTQTTQQTQPQTPETKKGRSKLEKILIPILALTTGLGFGLYFGSKGKKGDCPPSSFTIYQPIEIKTEYNPKICEKYEGLEKEYQEAKNKIKESYEGKGPAGGEEGEW